MGTRIIRSIINKLLLFIFILFFSALNANAASSLSGVDIKQISSGDYNIILKADNMVKVTKTTDYKDNLTLVLNSVVPVDTVEIVYDNASELKNVMVQKKNSENTMILLQGKNIENASIYVKDITTGIIKPINEKANSLNNYLYIANVKYFSMCVVGFIFMFFILISFKPKQSKSVDNVRKQYKTIKNTTINKLNKKAQKQKRYVPSINYRITGLEHNTTMPLNYNPSDISGFEEEEIRKVG